MFYNKTIKKKYNAQIWQHNIHHINLIIIKDVIISDNARENERQLVMANVIKLAKIAKMLN